MIKRNKKLGQVTIFIIVALVIVVGIVAYFLMRQGYTDEVPREFKPVYDYYISCLENQARQGISLMGEQAGWIEPPEFVPGSQYMPFSSQLDFFGQPVPYWLYVSGNNILKEQVPSKTDMQEQLSKYVAERVDFCDFADYPNFNVEIGDNPDVSVKIENLKVSVQVNNLVKMSSENQSVSVKSQSLSLDSKLGKFHELALEVYNFEKSQMFLEKYALDVLRLYEPVTGVELSCAPKVFNKPKISQDLKSNIAENVAMLKLKGDYYTLSGAKNKYFETNIGKNIDENVNFIYSSQWPSRVEIYGDDVAEPIGLQEGLGMLGFCYVPYHLVYDVNFPILIQFYDNNEVFQFPMAVIIDKNQARQALQGEAGQSIESEVCKYKDYPVQVNTYDSALNPVPASLKFKCLNTECQIGESEINGDEAVFSGNMPACVNGFIIASAKGYASSKYQISTNEESSANIILNKLYNVTLDLGKVDSALVYFKSPDYSTTVLYPDTQNVELIEGYYNVTVYAFKNSTIKLQAIAEKKCVNVPKSGIGGVFGLEEEKCFDINIPEQEISFAINGGGNAEEYITEGQLEGAKKLNINVPLFKTPTTLQEVQDNYLALEDSQVYIEVIQ